MGNVLRAPGSLSAAPHAVDQRLAPSTMAIKSVKAELRPRNTEPMILPEVMAHAELTMAMFFRGSSLRSMASVSGCDTARLLSVGRE